MSVRRSIRSSIGAHRRLLLGDGASRRTVGCRRSGRMNLYELFHKTAERQPERPAFLTSGAAGGLSYAAVDDAMVRAAARLREAGVMPGDCVGLHCASGANYVISTYAAWCCGACVVPIPIELASAEKERLLRTVGIDYV